MCVELVDEQSPLRNTEVVLVDHPDLVSS